MLPRDVFHHGIRITITESLLVMEGHRLPLLADEGALHGFFRLGKELCATLEELEV